MRGPQGNTAADDCPLRAGLPPALHLQGSLKISWTESSRPTPAPASPLSSWSSTQAHRQAPRPGQWRWAGGRQRGPGRAGPSPRGRPAGSSGPHLLVFTSVACLCQQKRIKFLHLQFYCPETTPFNISSCPPPSLLSFIFPLLYLSVYLPTSYVYSLDYLPPNMLGHTGAALYLPCTR